MPQGKIADTNTRFSFVIDKQLKANAECLARLEGKSLAQYINSLIEADIKLFEAKYGKVENGVALSWRK